MTTEDYKKLLPTLPSDAGVYQYRDKDQTVIYVGKAKNLKKRIASYFGDKKHQLHKTRTMIKNAASVEFTIVNSETDALLLENTLIKKLQPRYNVSLKDGKSYSYIVIKNERFPRVFITRKVFRDGSIYFGPYSSKNRLKIILDLIKQLFPLRTCNFNLSESNIDSGKFKVCLEYHIKNCKGACIGEEDEASYNDKIAQIKNMLRGNFGSVKNHFKQQMQTYAENLEFEKAQDLKVKLTAFEDYQGKSTVVSAVIKDVDVFSIGTDETSAYVNYIKVVNGAIINTFTMEMVKNLDEEEEDLLSFSIPELRERFNSNAPEIICPMEVPVPYEDITFTIPQRGDKKKLLELSEKNVWYYLMQKKKDAINKIKKQTPAERILKTLQSDLQMKELPMHIECFDNSNIQGTNPVASCVVFKNAKPSKKDYRKFNIKTVVGIDDFASMTEVVHRRYRRLLDEGEPLPQLLLVDGGKGQLSAAMKSIKLLGIENKIVVIGIAKRLEEIFFPDDPIPIYIDKKSESLKLMQHLRNEAHRFAITFHRNQRSKNFIDSELTKIPGIGDKTAQKLLSAFKSTKKVKEAPFAAIAAEIGNAAAMKVVDYFGKNEGE
jgi:excinuclease ABC subunit C